jgi:hypothetical protein
MVNEITTGFEYLRNSSAQKIEDVFKSLAVQIMSEWRLVLNTTPREWQITALELYLESETWVDPYVHGHTEQKNSATWYIHRYWPKNGGNTFRAPMYSGIDMTCGGNDRHGGILLRELNFQKEYVFQRIVRGEPNKVRENNKWSPNESDFISQINSRSIFDPTSPLYLKRSPSQNINSSIKARVGLRKKIDPSGKFRLAKLQVQLLQPS